MTDQRSVSRRGLLAVTGAGCSPEEKIDTAGEVSLDRPLAVPPLADSRTDASGRRVFALAAQRGNMEFRPGNRAETLGYNCDFLGPTLRARRGESPWTAATRPARTPPCTGHGMHLPAASDGPHHMVQPGGSWTPFWKVDQPAASLWYHPLRTARRRSRSSRGWPGCSSSTTSMSSRCRGSTASTISR